MFCFSAWLIVGQQTAQTGTVFPVERETPFIAENIRIDDVAVKVDVRFTTGNSRPFSSAEIFNFGWLSPCILVRADDGSINWCESQPSSARSSWVAMNQFGGEPVNYGRRLAEVFELIFDKQSIFLNLHVLKRAQALSDIDVDNVGIDVSSLDNRETFSGPLSSGCGDLGGDDSFFCVSALKEREHQKSDSGTNQGSGSVSEYFRESRKLTRIFRNQAFVVGFLWWCGIVVTALGWYEMIKGKSYFGILFLIGGGLVLVAAINISLLEVTF